MLDVMFDLPSREDAVKCIIHEGCITENAAPIIKSADGTELSLDKPKESA